jgi:predicted secreted protein
MGMAAIETVAIHGEAGVPVALPVVRGPATGYRWSLSLPEGVSQVADAPGVPVSPDQRLGGASGAPLSVVARPGVYRITATLARPWEPDKPARTVVILLTVQ